MVSFLCECILTCSTKKKKKEREKTVRFSSMMLLMMVVLPFNDVMTPLQWDEGLIFVFWANLTSQRDYLSFGRQSPDASHTVSCTTTNQDPVSYEKQGFFLYLTDTSACWPHYDDIMYHKCHSTLEIWQIFLTFYSSAVKGWFSIVVTLLGRQVDATQEYWCIW